MTDKIVLDVLPLFVECYVGIRKPHIHYQFESPIYTINLKAPYTLSIWKPHIHYQSESPIYTINLKAPYTLSIWKPHIHYQSESPIYTINLKVPYTLSIWKPHIHYQSRTITCYLCNITITKLEFWKIVILSFDVIGKPILNFF